MSFVAFGKVYLVTRAKTVLHNLAHDNREFSTERKHCLLCLYANYFVNTLRLLFFKRKTVHMGGTNIRGNLYTYIQYRLVNINPVIYCGSGETVWRC